MNDKEKMNSWVMLAGVVLLGLAAVMTGMALAQDEPAAQPAEQPNAPKSQEDVLEQLLKNSSPEPIITSRFGSDEVTKPTVVAVDPKTRIPLQVREGDVVINRLGRLDADPASQAVFVYEADGKALDEPPLILLPCQNLELMERLAKATPQAKFLVTGEITVYHGKGYLLLRKVMLHRDMGQF